MRRGHTKSRTGCLQCKQRHVKCDEAHPTCRLCANSNRQCSFSVALPSAKNASPGGSSTNLALSSTDMISGLPLTAASTDSTLSPLPADTTPPPLNAPLNLHHVELITHMMSNKDMFTLSFDTVGDRLRSLSYALTTGLNAPYALHQLLALSARHLSTLHPAGSRKSTDYRYLATTLQTRALSLFNAASLAKKGAVDHSNCTAVVLFSSTLAHHLLADALTHREPEQGGESPLDGFLARYLQAVETTRGVMVVSMAAWPLLMAIPEAAPTIAAHAMFAMREGKGDHCRGAREVVERAVGLSEAEREACRVAVRRLQVGCDAVEEEDKEDAYRFQMVFLWTMMVEPELTRLLAGKRPEALVLLGYYALLLWYARGMWQVGEAGRYLLGLVLEELGREWHCWLEYPREKMMG